MAFDLAMSMCNEWRTEGTFGGPKLTRSPTRNRLAEDVIEAVESPIKWYQAG